MKVLQAWKSSSWKVKTLIILASLYLLYALFGFLLAPGLVRDNASKALADLTGRQVNPMPLCFGRASCVFVCAHPLGGVLCAPRLYSHSPASSVSLFSYSWTDTRQP